MKTKEELFLEAKKISENSYSPYSNFPVGACCLFENGKTYLGVNVENVSYGLTLCAERNALSTAAANGEKKGFNCNCNLFAKTENVHSMRRLPSVDGRIQSGK